MSINKFLPDETPGFAPYNDVLLRGFGILVETTRRDTCSTATILVGGTIYYMAVPLRAGDTVNNLSICVATAGVAMTQSKLGLYTKTGLLVASSANLGASWESTGFKTATMSAAYTVPTTGIYYVAIIGTGGTLPVVVRSPVGSVTIGTIGASFASNPQLCFTQTAQTDLVAVATIADPPTTAFIYWAGIS